MEFTIDYGNLGAPVVTRAPLVASVAGSAVPIGEHRFLFRIAATGATHVVDAADLQAMDASRAFAPLEAHAQAIARVDPNARARLQALLRQGLLVDASAWLATIAAGPDAALAPEGPVFIRACDRPAQLDALLATLAQNEDAHGGRHRYVVLDDSRDAANVARHAQSLRAFAQAAGVAVRHVDPADWTRRVAALVAACPAQASAIRFLIGRDGDDGLRFGGGKGYVLASLLGAGTRYALLDDDFLLPLRRCAVRADVTMVLDAPPDAPVHFHDSVETALAAGEPLAGDPVRAHLAWCGMTLAQLWRAQPPWRPRVDALRGISPSPPQGLDATTRIVATGNGHRGASGTANSDWLLLLPPEERAALTRDEPTFRAQLAGGGVWSGDDRARVLAQGHFTPFVVDGARFLPPTMPAGRAEDLLFGMLCRAVDPTSVVLATPWTMGHRQERARDRAGARAETPGLNHFLNDWLGSRLDEVRAATPAARLTSIAGRLGDLADASASTRVELVAEFLRFRRADLAMQLEATLHEARDAPAYWRAEVEARIAANRAALRDAAPPRLAGWDAATDDAAIAKRFAREVGGFADALARWPALWQHALARAGALLDD